jgi:hypothetical protein
MNVVYEVDRHLKDQENNTSIDRSFELNCRVHINITLTSKQQFDLVRILLINYYYYYYY